MKITNIEQISHIYFKETHGIFSGEMFIIHYSSGREITYKTYERMPKTAKAFLKTHYDTLIETETTIRYIYKAINIIK